MVTVRKFFRMSEQGIGVEIQIPEQQVEEAEDRLMDSTEGTQDHIEEQPVHKQEGWS